MNKVRFHYADDWFSDIACPHCSTRYVISYAPMENRIYTLTCTKCKKKFLLNSVQVPEYTVEKLDD